MTANKNMVQSGPAREFAISERDFHTIAALARDRFGLDLQASKMPLVYSRLGKRLRQLELASFSEYCELLGRENGSQEETHLLTALTTNVTHFFREPHHFDFLRDVIAPGLIAQAKAGRPVRLWSAACSSGQEAYSIAATLLALEPRAADLNIRILATDIDPLVIATARSGLYPAEQAEKIPATYRKLMIGQCAGDVLAIKDPLKALIRFGELNLIREWPMRRPFDVIFCRNAAIYFEKKTQHALWSRFASVLVDGGHMLIGHSERVTGPAEAQFTSAGITVYCKKSNRKLNEEGKK